MADGKGPTYPLPDDPVLAQAAAAVRDAGHWGWVVDRSWNVVYITDDHRLSFGAGSLATLPLGGHLLGPEMVTAFRQLPLGLTTTAHIEDMLHGFGGAMLADAAGDREALRASVAPELRKIVDELEPDYRTVSVFRNTCLRP